MSQHFTAGDEIKLLSLWDPWAMLMALGAKRIETRSWSTRYRGWLAIHASKGGLTKTELREVMSDIIFKKAIGGEQFLPGRIIAVVRLLDCLPMEDTGCIHGVFSDYPEMATGKEIYFGDYTPGRFAWVTEDVIRLPRPIPFSAMQRLTAVPRETAAEIAEQLMEVKAA